MISYEVWIEGFQITGQSAKAERLLHKNITLWEASTFQEACEKACIAKDWDMKYYDKNKNTYWACNFYDNEKDARKSFG